MKTPIFIIAFICFLANANAQSFAVIKDRDGYVNIRKNKSSNATIVGKLCSNSIFSLWEDDENKSDWVKIYSQQDNNKGIEGYVHKSRILLLSSLNSIRNIQHQNNFCTAKNDSINIKISSSKFITKNHRLKYHKSSEYNVRGYYEKIDGKQIWGRDGDLPNIVITAVSVTINGKIITIPKSAFNDLYEPNFSTFKVYLGLNNAIFMELDNSDGAGAYSVIWVIKNDRYLNRYIDNSEV